MVSSDSKHRNNIKIEEDIYNPSLKNEPLKNIIIHNIFYIYFREKDNFRYKKNLCFKKYIE